MEEVIANRYRLGAALGVGGMARVVEAHDLRLDRTVAVKLVPVSGIERSGRARFVAEARSAAGFSHPNAVGVYDAGESDRYLYLVMELVDGPSLAARLADRGRLDVDEAVRITDAVLAALGAAHAAGIVHRDVKPGNILLGRAEVKLADFGIAKRLGDAAADLTGTGQFVGTPKYLAPEQVMGLPATPATDLYAVGIVLYEMLAGRPPYAGDTPVATAIAHRDAPIPDVRRVRPDVPDHVAMVVRRAMAKDPAERYRTAGDMATALATPVAPEPTQVMMVSPRPFRRRRSRAWLWAAAAGLAVGGGVALALSARDDEPNAGAGNSMVAVATAAPTSAPATTVAATEAPTTQQATTPPTTPPTSPPTTSPPTAPAQPTTLDELISFIESDTDRFGSRSTKFLDKLRKVAEENGRKQSDRADDLLREMDDWVSDGELSVELVPITEFVLGPIADGPGNSGDGDD